MAVLDVNPDRRRRKKTVNFAFENYHGRQRAEPVNRRDWLGCRAEPADLPS
jgi:hypothetical protein